MSSQPEKGSRPKILKQNVKGNRDFQNLKFSLFHKNEGDANQFCQKPTDVGKKDSHSLGDYKNANTGQQCMFFDGINWVSVFENACFQIAHVKEFTAHCLLFCQRQSAPGPLRSWIANSKGLVEPSKHTHTLRAVIQRQDHMHVADTERSRFICTISFVCLTLVWTNPTKVKLPQNGINQELNLSKSNKCGNNFLNLSLLYLDTAVATKQSSALTSLFCTSTANPNPKNWYSGVRIFDHTVGTIAMQCFFLFVFCFCFFLTVVLWDYKVVKFNWKNVRS